jgi:hypothetical protein
MLEMVGYDEGEERGVDGGRSGGTRKKRVVDFGGQRLGVPDEPR